MKLILASQSPRRRRLIELFGLPVQTTIAAVDEDSIDHPDPATNVVQTAQLKAEAVGDQFADGIIIAADTTVALDGEMLNKPADDAEAQNMLRRLRGRVHQVYTGIALLQSDSRRCETTVCTTDVYMRDYTGEEIEQYIRSGDPFDKAGAYAIQNTAFRPVSQIRGCYTNVVGLPLCQLQIMLGRFGVRSTLAVDAATEDHRKCDTCRMLINTRSI